MAHHLKAATSTYFKPVQLFAYTATPSTDVPFKWADHGTYASATAFTAPASGLQVELYAMHIYVADTITVSIESGDGGAVVWAVPVPQYDSQWYFPLASPLLVGDAAIPYVLGSGDQATTIYAYGAIRSVT